MNGSQSENQKYNQYQLPVNVDAVIGDKLIQSTARHISCCGMCLTTRCPVKVGEDACVVFCLSDKARPIKLKGKTVKIEPDGVNIEFHGLSPYFVPYFDEILEEAFQRTAL